MSVEREVLLTGIGGQGIQLGAQVLARAAVTAGREVMLFGSYGGTMRGGSTDATLIVADAPVAAPPIVSHAWSALAMHPAGWPAVEAKLVADAVVVVNASLVEASRVDGGRRVFEVPATRLASEQGSALGAALVLVGAYAAVTGLVPLEALLTGLADSLPARRRALHEANERALRAGFAALPRNAAPAWPSEERAA